ncbi:MAG TPA: class I SAM-dependent methyltransferase [Nitratidesulfovibrio sp.]|nr:class I SAM-dependent methyltransferase [Nitratidesulfovibrio sp.]
MNTNPPQAPSSSEAVQTAQAACVVCGHARTARADSQPEDFEYAVIPGPESHIRHCPACGSRFLHPRPDLTTLSSYYPLDYHAYNEDNGLIADVLVGMRSKARARDYMRHMATPTIRLFDVGTGDCRQFDALRPLGDFRFGGVELKPEMVQAARAKGYDVHEGSLEGLNISGMEGQFDIVTMYQLVEHVLRPDILLQKAIALLRPGGMVVGQLPSMDSLERRIFGRYWAGYHFPRHLQMFTRRGLAHNLTHAGFTNVVVTSSLHLQAALSLQNLIVANLPSRPRLRFGKIAAYSFLLLAAAPFCLLEHALGMGGMMHFRAVKPLREERT